MALTPAANPGTPDRWWFVAGAAAFVGVSVGTIVWLFPTSMWTWIVAGAVFLFAIVAYLNPRYRLLRRASFCFATAGALAFVPSFTAKVHLPSVGVTEVDSRSSSIPVLGFLAVGVFLVVFDSRQNARDRGGSAAVDSKQGQKSVPSIATGSHQVRVERSIAFSELLRLIESSQRAVRILDAWVSRPEDLCRVLRVPHPSDRRTRILLLDIGTKTGKFIIRQRHRDLRRDVGHNLARCAEAFDQLADLVGQGVEVHRFSALPPFNLYWVDDLMFIGLFWHTQLSSEGPFLTEISAESPLYLAAAQTFERLWNAEATGEDGKSFQNEIRPQI